MEIGCDRKKSWQDAGATGGERIDLAEMGRSVLRPYMRLQIERSYWWRLRSMSK
jgi:hypothetical protein